MPSVCFAQELIEAYPDAKIILTVREESGWYQSFNKGVIETYWDNCGLTRALSVFDQKLMRPIHLLWTKLFAEADGYFGSSTREHMQVRSVEKYRWHNDMVVRSVEPSRLLIFDMADGWAPLCGFLALPIPSAPFPRVNETSAVKNVVAAFMRRSLSQVLRNLSVVIGTIAVIAYLLVSR